MDDKEIPDEFISALGRMTLQWGRLEALTMMAFSKFAGYDGGLDPRAIIVMANAGYSQRIDTISALCEHLSDDYPHLEDRARVIKLLRGASKGRNKYSHNTIHLDDDGHVYVSYATARDSLVITNEIVRLTEIDEVTKKITEAGASLMELITGKKYPRKT